METNKNTIKIFQIAKEQLAALKIYANKRRFHKQQLVHIVEALIANILQYVYLFCFASTAREYMNSIYMATAGTLVFICYWSAIFKTEDIFLYIDELETTINESWSNNLIKMKFETQCRDNLYLCIYFS